MKDSHTYPLLQTLYPIYLFIYLSLNFLNMLFLLMIPHLPTVSVSHIFLLSLVCYYPCFKYTIIVSQYIVSVYVSTASLCLEDNVSVSFEHRIRSSLSSTLLQF